MYKQQNDIWQESEFQQIWLIKTSRNVAVDHSIGFHLFKKIELLIKKLSDIYKQGFIHVFSKLQ